jgi:hypothetical protein
MSLSTITVKCLNDVAQTSDELKRAAARLRVEVEDARRAGASWESIGNMLGTTGEAARQRFAPKRPGQQQRSGAQTLDMLAAVA